jgi:hypothetical protein
MDQPLKELLIQVYEKWDWIIKRRGIDVPCPISFTREEIREAREQTQAWAAAFNEFDGLRAQIVCKDGGFRMRSTMRQWPNSMPTRRLWKSSENN